MSECCTVIMPCYNSESFIRISILSVINQTFEKWELLIIDDNSTDNTVSLVEELAKNDPRIKLFKNSENLGAGASRNKAIEHAQGRYIAFLDADDLWHPQKLEKQIAFMQENDIALSYTQYQKFDESGDLGIVVPPDTVTYDELLYSNVIGCLTAVYDSEKLGKRYMPLIRKRQDMGLWLTILKDIPKAFCLQENLAKYRIDSGMTKNKLTVLGYQWRFYREVVGLNIFKSAYTFMVYAYKGFIKSRI
ncbi:glycosyltransferase family 2 protein [Paraferrimonas sp. SM1919]|uniref:glycosyltransferase family 2 protein n=1 Tax=Paraferrimonas sp. SM1919 TaxID=2662263 RepID=UPI0013D3D36E|nr:glycosyltransferase family 2 protein [Paraferrimonas sp. SM1919]